MMNRLSRFVCGSVDWTSTLPPRIWRRGSATLGGARVSASGVGAAHLIRRDRILTLTLIFLEAQWPALDELIAEMQTMQIVQWYPDARDGMPYHYAYLHAPLVGETYEETLSQTYPLARELTIQLRRADGAWNLLYFPDEA